jgi:transcriptional regulator with XRE-family HTH domain
MRRVRSELLEPGLLRAARAAAGYDQTELADHAGLSPETISRIERSVAKRIYDVVDVAIRRALQQRGVTVRRGDGDAVLLEISRRIHRPSATLNP